MNAAAPGGAPPHRISDQNSENLSRPAVPRRGLEAGEPRNYFDFFGKG